MARRATFVYLTLSAASAAASTLAFAAIALYRYRAAGLSDLQLVLVGTAMEATVFLGEVPTGIVADLYSRKWSVVIGHAGMGAGLLVEASHPGAVAVFAGTVLWGLSYTFTSGAELAWFTVELGEPDGAALSDVLLRASRMRSATALAALPVTFVLASWSLRSPIVAAAAVELALAAWLGSAMAESGFERVADEDRSTWQHLAAIGRSGFTTIRASRALLLVTAVLFLAGGSSEAYDRYEQKHLVEDVGLPGSREFWWLAAVSVSSSVIGIVVPSVVRRAKPGASSVRLGRWLAGAFAVQLAGLVVFALSRSFALALLAIVVLERARSVRSSLMGALIVPLTPKRERATVLSALEQADAISQTTLGPMMGVVGGSLGVPAALVISALVLVPAIPIVRLVPARVPT